LFVLVFVFVCPGSWLHKSEIVECDSDSNFGNWS
jgi:hypothetical protein